MLHEPLRAVGRQSTFLRSTRALNAIRDLHKEMFHKNDAIWKIVSYKSGTTPTSRPLPWTEKLPSVNRVVALVHSHALPTTQYA